MFGGGDCVAGCVFQHPRCGRHNEGRSSRPPMDVHKVRRGPIMQKQAGPDALTCTWAVRGDERGVTEEPSDICSR